VKQAAQAFSLACSLNDRILCVTGIETLLVDEYHIIAVHAMIPELYGHRNDGERFRIERIPFDWENRLKVDGYVVHKWAHEVPNSKLAWFLKNIVDPGVVKKATTDCFEDHHRRQQYPRRWDKIRLKFTIPTPIARCCVRENENGGPALAVEQQMFDCEKCLIDRAPNEMFESPHEYLAHYKMKHTIMIEKLTRPAPRLSIEPYHFGKRAYFQEETTAADAAGPLCTAARWGVDIRSRFDSSATERSTKKRKCDCNS
jgi:hypothetical protein